MTNTLKSLLFQKVSGSEAQTKNIVIKKIFMERPYEKINLDDLKKLAEIARADCEDLFSRKPELGNIYKNRLICIALCQGAALHYIDGKIGINDFDVWSFFCEHNKRPFPYRRNVPKDFGDSKFGKSPDRPDFTGRRVDLLGRSIPCDKIKDPIEIIRNYLIFSKNKTPKLLAKKRLFY